MEKNLLCLRHQSLLPNELVIVDDGSSEDLLGLLQKTDFPFPVKYVHQEDKGFRLARCRNNGARAASGDYFIFLDQDIVYTKNYLATFIENACENRFLSPYPIRLCEKQSLKLTDEMVKIGDYRSIVTRKQVKKVKCQYYEDIGNQLLFKLGVKEFGSKIRGLSLGLFKSDYIQVNGFDEKFIGWGNEDDDLGRRLHKSHIIGGNVFKNEYPVHLWHPPHHNNGERVNVKYNRVRKREIRHGSVRPEYGYDNTYGDDPVKVIEIN